MAEEKKVFIGDRLVEINLNLADHLETLEPGSTEHQAVVDEMAVIGDTLTKIVKYENDEENARIQREHECKMKKIEIVGDILKVAIPATLSLIGTAAGLVVIVEMNNVNMVAEYNHNMFVQSGSSKKGEFLFNRIFRPSK